MVDSLYHDICILMMDTGVHVKINGRIELSFCLHCRRYVTISFILINETLPSYR